MKRLYPWLFIGLFAALLCCSKKSDNGGGTNTGPTPPVKPDTTPVAPVKTDVTLWLTKADQSVLLQKQNIALLFSTATNANATISVDTTQTYQSIDGFGYCLTGGSAYLLNHMAAADRDAALRELFSTDSGCIGVSYLRISIGASDLNANVFTYDDMPAGQQDTSFAYFGLSTDMYDLVPILQEVVAINPAIKILGSPWTAPIWMKTNNSSVGGNLQSQYFGVYANYFVKYIQAMKAQGITVDAITPQNEPMNPNNNPSMLLPATDEAAFVKNNLGPALRAAGLNTKIIIFDHNCGNPEYPLAILGDAAALNYIDGTGFHLYGGDISALTTIHNAAPTKNVYFTEQWVGGPGNFPSDLEWAMKNLIIGATRNWSRNVLEWNLANDPNYQPHTPGGCSTCLGAFTIGATLSRNVSYYIIAHASKFVRPGSVRIASNLPGNLQNVAFKTPDGKKVLIVLNDNSSAQTFNIQFNGKMVTSTLDAGAVGTYIW
jgi:glucosylceramidase